METYSSTYQTQVEGYTYSTPSRRASRRTAGTPSR